MNSGIDLSFWILTQPFDLESRQLFTGSDFRPFQDNTMESKLAHLTDNEFKNCS